MLVIGQRYILLDPSFEIVPVSVDSHGYFMCDLYMGTTYYPKVAEYNKDGECSNVLLPHAPRAYMDLVKSSMATGVDWSTPLSVLKAQAALNALGALYVHGNSVYYSQISSDPMVFPDLDTLPQDVSAWSPPTCDCSHAKHNFWDGHAKWCALTSV